MQTFINIGLEKFFLSILGLKIFQNNFEFFRNKTLTLKQCKNFFCSEEFLNFGKLKKIPLEYILYITNPGKRLES